jgi:hypothetical protein
MHRVRAVPPRCAGFSAILLIALLASSGGMATELYKWTDDKGVVHYSDTPPGRGKDSAPKLHINDTEDRKNDTEGRKSDAEGHKPAASAEANAVPSGSGQTPAANSATDDRRRACDQARAALELLQGQAPVADAASGKVLDEKARAERTASTQQAVDFNCRNPG